MQVSRPSSDVGAYIPLEQEVHTELPDEEIVPAGHTVQVDKPSAAAFFPAGQLEQVSRPVVAAMEPDRHTEHVLSPTSAAIFPSEQRLQLDPVNELL